MTSPLFTDEELAQLRKENAELKAQLDRDAQAFLDIAKKKAEYWEYTTGSFVFDDEEDVKQTYRYVFGSEIPEDKLKSLMFTPKTILELEAWIEDLLKQVKALNTALELANSETCTLKARIENGTAFLKRAGHGGLHRIGTCGGCQLLEILEGNPSKEYHCPVCGTHDPSKHGSHRTIEVGNDGRFTEEELREAAIDRKEAEREARD